MKFVKSVFSLLKQIGLISLIKTIIFNFHYFGYKKGHILPVLVSKNVLFKIKKGEIIIDKFDAGVIKIGFGNVGIFDKRYDRTVIEFCEQSIIEFKGSANIGHGSRISVQSNAKLIFGDNFCITANSAIICAKQVEFGDNCLLSWDILIMDSDLHQIMDDNDNIINNPKPLFIKDDIWIGAQTTILKGVEIGSGNVIGANSLVTKSFPITNAVIAGSPARVLKTNIKWKR